MNIIIGFSKSLSPWKIGSKAIQEGEKRNYSHVYIRYSDPTTNVNLICQASHGLVNEMATDIFLTHNVIVKEYNIKLNFTEFVEILTFLRKNLGKPYSKLQLVFIGIKKLLHFEVRVSNNDSSFICSELAGRVCQILGIEIKDKLDYVTPSDIDFLLESNNIPYGNYSF